MLWLIHPDLLRISYDSTCEFEDRVSIPMLQLE